MKTKLKSVLVTSVVWAAMLLACGSARAIELDFLQTDPRFTGGEFNASDPSRPNFWFYDQYANARYAMQSGGMALVPVTLLTYANLDANSDALYMPVPTNPSASAYPLTNAEIATLKEYVANSKNTGGRSVIFNLSNGVSASMTNDLLLRLGLNGHMASGNITGPTSYPNPSQPLITGPVGAVGSYSVTNNGYFDSLGTMRSLIDVNGKSILPYVEKGDLGSTAGSYFFILDPNILTNWSAESVSEKNLFMNLVHYATQDQFLHYVPPANPPAIPEFLPVQFVPEPGALTLLGLGAASMLARRRQRGH